MNKRKLVTKVGSLVLVVGGGYLLYTFCLSEKAKKEVKDAAHNIKEAYEKIADAIETVQGQVMEDDQPLPNVQATKSQWASIGY